MSPPVPHVSQQGKGSESAFFVLSTVRTEVRSIWFM